MGLGTPMPLHRCCIPEGCWPCPGEVAHWGPASPLSAKGELRRGWKGKQGSRKSHRDSSSAACASRASLGFIQLPGMMLCPAGVLHAGGVWGGGGLWSPMRLAVPQGSQGLADRVRQQSLISPYQDFPNSVDRSQRHRQCRVHSAVVIWLPCATRDIV